MAAKKKKPAPKPDPNFVHDQWDDPWAAIRAAPDAAFSPQAQENRAPQPPPVDPAWQAWQQQLPGLQGNVYAEYGNPALQTDPNATFAQKYGYQGGQLRNTLGLTETGEIDVNNPFGQAMLLQQSYEKGQRGTSNSMAAGGQLYSGAHQRQLDQGTSQYNQGQHGITSSYQQGLHGITQHGLGLLTDLDNQTTDRLGDHTSFVNAYTPEPTPVGQSLYQQAGSPAPTHSPDSDGQSTQYATFKPPKKKKPVSKLTPKRR